MASSNTSPPTTLVTVRTNAWAAHVHRLHDAPGRRHEDAVEAVVEEAGEAARGVEEVEGVAGRRRVDDDEVEVALVVELVELLRRHVLLRARERAGDVLVEAVGEDALGLGRRRRRCSTTRASKVGLVSSISAHSSPGQSPSIWVGVLERPSRPSASASRLAGSMVTTTARRPRRAASRASTAAVVVLPTPPEPQQTRMRRSARPARARGARRGGHQRPPAVPRSTPSSASASASSSAGPRSATEQERAGGAGGAAAARASRATCSACSGRALGPEGGGRGRGLGLAGPERGARPRAAASAGRRRGPRGRVAGR